MFNQLSERLAKTVKNLRGQGRLSEDNIKDISRELRMALLEADVALPVVKSFVTDIKEKALNQEVSKHLDPGQAFIKIVKDELTHIMGEKNSELNLKAQPPAVVLMAGLQGAGKTTTVAKLAKRLKEKDNKTVMVASADIYRPAAIEQLKTLADSVGVKFFASSNKQRPEDIATAALDTARKQHVDVLIFDTAGRLTIDEKMMAEIKHLHNILEPVETLFVVDSMTGQDAATTAKAFNEALPLTGIILTKTDGDARGGAALSVRQITGKPIKFIGVGEKTDALEPFHPDRIASQILGMGDVLSLIEEVENKVDKKQADKVAKKLKKGKKLTLQDFASQLEQMDKMGGMSKLMGKLPGVPNLPAGALEQAKNNPMTTKMLAIIRSMTPQERKFPDLLKASRKRRIASGSGTQVQDVNRLLKQFLQMQKMLKRFGKNPAAMKNMMGNMGGGLPF